MKIEIELDNYINEDEKKNEDIIEKLFKEISEKRAEIIDNFLKMFVASRLEWFKEKPERLRRIKLIEERSNDGLKTTYRIEVMTGKKAKNITNLSSTPSQLEDNLTKEQYE